MKYLYITLLSFCVASCAGNESGESTQTPAIPADTPAPAVKENSAQKVAGSYVSTDYAERAKGYDWVSVNIQNASQEEISISIRSRADKKKPTCTLDAKATKTVEGVYKTTLEKGAVVYTFLDHKLTISAEPGTPEGALNYYCSGGGSIAGTYTHIEGMPDSSQIDKTAVK